MQCIVLLLQSSYFGNHEANRGGFEKLYRELSDEAWEKSIDLIKFITKRGGHMEFNQLNYAESSQEFDKVYYFVFIY